MPDSSASPDTAVGAAEAAVSEVVRYIFAQYPHCPRRAGLPGFDALLPQPGPRPVDDIARMRSRVSGQLDSLPATVEPDLRADLHAAAKFLDAERFEVESLGWACPNPLEQLAETDISSYLADPSAPAAERIDAMTAHLAALPNFLRQAAGFLGDQLTAGTRLRCTERAMLQALRIRDLARTAAKVYPGRRGVRLEAVGESAAKACEEYGQAVAALRPVGGVLGPERVAGYLAAMEGIDHPTEDLLEEVRAEVAEVVSALDAAAGGVGAAGRAQAYALLADQVSEEPVLTAVRSAIGKVADFWRARDVVSVAVDNPLEVSLTSSKASTAEIVFDIGAPLAQHRLPYVLRVPDLDSADGGGTNLRREYLNDAMLEIIAVHETFVGHYVHTEATLRRPSVMRSCVRWSAGFPEGWSHYAEELAVEQGLAAGRPLVRIAQLKTALEFGMRCLIYLSVHLGRWTFAQAVEQAASLCHWSLDRAVREVLLTTSHLSTAMYTMGKLRIREWRKVLGTAVATHELKDFHDRILQCGYAPLSTVWQYYRDSHRLPSQASVRRAPA